MVLDPGSAISLAAAVIQFVDFGTKLISKGTQIYKSENGVLADDEERSGISSRLSNLNKGLSDSIINSQLDEKSSPAELALIEVTLACRVQADEFTSAIERLKVTGKHRKWNSFRQALKSIWSKEELNRKFDHLNCLQQQVLVHLLVVQGDTQNDLNALILEAKSRNKQILEEIRQCEDDLKLQIEDLSTSLEKLSKQQSSGNDDNAQAIEAAQLLVSKWQTQNGEALDEISHRLFQKDIEEKQVSFQRKVLDSLHFEKIDDRQNMINEKNEMTLGWVFNNSPQSQSQWSDIPSWLRGPDGLYWVSGKAGSGKSTLMKWLLNESRTKDFLKTWSGDRRLLVANHFFWGPGTETQKSLTGLLRSVLYDLLRQCPDHISRISPTLWRSYDLELAHFPAWTDADLKTALRRLIEETNQSICVCLFIDGLDEFVGKDHQRVKVVELLKNLSAHRHVKICVSSRPLELFKQSFGNCPNLRLEDLTRRDIEKYIRITFEANDDFRALQGKNTTLCSQIIYEIIKKANGVWLWVVLVVQSVLRGLRNQDPISDLLERLREIPEELERYFSHIFGTVDITYHPKAFKLLTVVLRVPELSLMTASFLDEEDPLYPFNTPIKAITQGERTERLHRTESRINIWCMGLLEITDSHVTHEKTVVFLHQAAREFVLGAGLRNILKVDTITSFDVDQFICEALLGQMKMIESATRPLLSSFLKHASALERRSSPPLQPLLDHLSYVLKVQQTTVSLHPAASSDPGLSWNLADQGSAPLLTLAIQYGLPGYVKENLLSNPRLVVEQKGRPLLDFALRRAIDTCTKGQAKQIDNYVGDRNYPPDIETIHLILDQGGNPNEKYDNSTVWKRFVEYLYILSPKIRYHDAGAPQQWIDVTELLIRYGAARVLESEHYVRARSSARTKIDLGYREKLARDEIAAAFGEREASRLDYLSWSLNVTGRNLITNITRGWPPLFRQQTV